MSAQIKITSHPLFPENISPLIYGDFIEFIDELIRGMWAERLEDRAFEGLTDPSAEVYRRTRDYTRPVWRELKAFESDYGKQPNFRLTYNLDPVRPFMGTRSARIQVSGDKGFLAGIMQENVGVRRDETLSVELYMRAEGLQGTVRVFVGREYGAYVDTYDQVVFNSVDGEWRKFSGTLKMSVADPQACFAIVLDGPGTVWVDKVSLMPTDNCDGWRADIVAAVKAMKPGIMRFGGSSFIYYDWQKGVGPREKRMPFFNIPWNNTEENDVGLDEFLRFCELVEAEPLICVNSNSSSPEHIADEVEYVNGPVATEFGRMRAENGHPAPYNVKYWQIGNEQRGDVYEKSLAAFIKAMKTKDPGLILMASYPSKSIIDNLSKQLDYVCPHPYSADFGKISAQVEALRKDIAQSPQNPKLKVGMTEWSHSGGDWGEQRAWLKTLFNALHAARMLNLFQRNGDIIRIANHSNITNSFCGGSIQASSTDMYFIPTYYVQKSYANLSGSVAVKTESTEGGLDISGTMDANGKRYMIWIVNDGAKAIEADLVTDGLGTPIAAKTIVITGQGPSAVNSFERKTNVAPVEEILKPAARLRHRFQAYSITGVELMFT